MSQAKSDRFSTMPSPMRYNISSAWPVGRPSWGLGAGGKTLMRSLSVAFAVTALAALAVPAGAETFAVDIHDQGLSVTGTIFTDGIDGEITASSDVYHIGPNPYLESA